VLIKGLDAMSDDACYRAMDWLLEISGALEKEIFEPPTGRRGAQDGGFRTWGKSQRQ
jgi:hypothetical protein